MKRYIALMALGLTLLAGGCRSLRQGAEGSSTTNDTSAGDRVTTKLYTTNFTVEAQGLSANGQMRMMEDSILWISASKVIELGRARFTPDSVVVYAIMMNRYFSGTYEDLYRRFMFRTDFKTLSEAVRAEDAGARLAEMARQLGIEATVAVEPWKKVSKLTFPFALPKSVKPL